MHHHQPRPARYEAPHAIPHGYYQQQQQQQQQQWNQQHQQTGGYPPQMQASLTSEAHVAARWPNYPQQPYGAAPIPRQPHFHHSHPVVMIPPQASQQQQQQQQQQQYQPYPIPSAHYLAQHTTQPSQSPYPQQSRNLTPLLPATQPPPAPRQPVVQVHIPPPAPPAPPSVNYQQLLISLAEEYIAAARTMGSRVALSGQQSEEDAYYKLMSTGLGCLESAIKNCRMSPRTEAMVVLRYASLLQEETRNLSETEDTLSKGIAHCAKHRLWDLKYTMQHLLARFLFESNPAASLHQIAGVLDHAKMHNHVPWLYAFLFLRASLCMQSGTHIHVNIALSSLREAADLSQRLGDHAVYVASNTFLATLHLRLASADSVEHAQRCIASARSLQLQLSADDLGQFIVLLNLADLACSLKNYTPDQAVAKLHDLQAVMDAAVSADNKQDNGVFSVLIHGAPNEQITLATGSIFQRSSDGRDRLSLAWMRRRDLWMLGYYLSGVTAALKNPIDEKAERYLKEGQKLTRETLAIADHAPISVHGASARMEWHRCLGWHFCLQQCFLACNKADWKTAQTLLTSLQQFVPVASDTGSPPLSRFAIYLDGVIQQGLGNTEAALDHFRTLIDTNADSTRHPAQLDLGILAIMNSLLIIRPPTHPMHSETETLLREIEPRCQSHPNYSMRSACQLLKAAVGSETASIVSMKQCIQQALHAAKAVANNQLLCICMNHMTAAFFTNIIGEQTEKSAKAGRVLAVRARDRLWQCVADGMLAHTYEQRGDKEQASLLRQEAETLLPYLPVPLRDARG